MRELFFILGAIAVFVIIFGVLCLNKMGSISDKLNK